MLGDSDVVANFAPGGHQFAFQANSNLLQQKNTIDIYPLDSASNYEVNSAQVNHLDYENNGFKASDILFLGWCTENSSGKIKRKLDGDNNSLPGSENFFINAFGNNQVVVYSSNGKDIINIINSKKKLLGLATLGVNIWTLDVDKCVKKYQYNKSKPVKTFTLIDGKNEDITNFQVFASPTDALVLIICENTVYVIDQSGRRPKTLAKFDIFGALSCQINTKGTRIAISDIEKVSLFDLKTKELIKEWPVQTTSLKMIGSHVYTLNVDSTISVLDSDAGDEPVCTIRADESVILECVQIHETDLLVAWLNVNEPNFKLLSLETILSCKEIVINEGQTDANNENNGTVTRNVVDEEDIAELEPSTEKVTKKEQNEVAVKLLAALNSPEPIESEIATLIKSNNWTEPRITLFLSNKISKDATLTLLIKIIVDELQNGIWTEANQILNVWLKWICTIKNIPSSYRNDKQEKKDLRRLKSSLKTANDSLPTLLGIQGRLEMLIRQAKLREELQKVSLEDEKTEDLVAEDVIDEGEEGISYVNGESDVFVDASEQITS
ncbi:Utp9p KNAG_0B06760 [Huiozyma naganishii CBS 8797]|uniref:Small-subunit processome Utp12 domain-containing protein n=1 Tax=Huiozyma naganishii (strain ATCC MYA-139 / BCRC 22969 / CBS 8797 / KCTC 17520 / NBRC 10181 / NCYC 3082 / Yp74L-3) TaxID=1071383 RepID=J7S5E6_HUIN7|nr:hypothetical protein KNAG_0B06760 [Kazachstania naganishii CBS 8797]CCK69101.1 hypothetical protein KNAG_0B06760 [Kazachstania naganishii CBS 8797]